MRKFDTRLASGMDATVLRIDVTRLDVLPLSLEMPSAAEAAIAAGLGQARQEYQAPRFGMTARAPAMAPVPLAADRLDPPEDVTTPWGRMRLYARRARAQLDRDRFAMAPLHLLRLTSARLETGELMVNANHFLFLPPELEALWNAYGDPIGLVAADGEVAFPAQLNRSCLVEDARGFAIRRISFADHVIELPDGSEIAPHPYGPPQATAARCAFSLFHGSVEGATPPAEGAVDLACLGRHPLALKQGGGMPIPTAGCVLRFESVEAADAAARAGPIRYRLGTALRSGVQSGPRILRAGRSTREEAEDVLVTEAMAPDTPLPDTALLSPHVWKADWDETRAARLSAGITAAGALFFCAVEGTSSFLGTGGDPKGATLDDLAELMRSEGAVEALHLDGGGSTQVFAPAGGAVIQPLDIHHGADAPAAQYDRPLPLALKLA